MFKITLRELEIISMENDIALITLISKDLLYVKFVRMGSGTFGAETRQNPMNIMKRLRVIFRISCTIRSTTEPSLAM